MSQIKDTTLSFTPFSLLPAGGLQKGLSVNDQWQSKEQTAVGLMAI
jgi:hypothetical protein